MEQLIEQGIRLRSWREGDHKTVCPKCSDQRKNKKDPCLSVTIETDGAAVWKCHHCDWRGGLGGSNRGDGYRTPPAKKKPPVRLVEPSNPVASDEILRWLEGRGISKLTVEHFGLYRSERSFGGNPEGCIAFPYRVDGELVNCKYRTKDKRFRQENGAQRTLYNIDSVRRHWDVTGQKEVIFVEGEMDVLTMHEAGFANAVTLPDGAPQEAKFQDDDKRFQALAQHEWLNDAEKVIIAVDGDGAGQALQLELLHRFGKDRCWTVEWPSLHDIVTKDANDVLVAHGYELLQEVMSLAKPCPIDGLFSVGDYQRDVINIYRGNVQKPVPTGFANLDSIYQVMPSTFNLVTGIPNHGKSNFIDQLAVNLCRDHGWKFAVFSPEHSTANHIRRLAEKVAKKPFDVGPNVRMTEAELVDAMLFLDNHFHFIECEDNVPTIDWLLGKARAACMRFGVKGIIIDPYNEIDSSRDGNKREDEHIRDLISMCKQFCRKHNIAMWMVAHPAKMQRQADGSYPPPSLYDVSGSAHWNNMCDVGIVVHRDFDENETRVITRKVREQGLYGSIGEAFFRYNLATHCYEEAVTVHSGTNTFRSYHWTEND